MTAARPAGRVLDPRAFCWFLSYYRPRSRRLVLFTLGASANSLLVLPVLWLIRHAFDVVIPGGDVRGLVFLGVAILGLRAVASALSLVLRSHILRTVKGAVSEMRADLVAHLYGRARAFFSRADAAVLQTRIVQDSERVDNLSNTLFYGMIPALFAALVLVVVLGILNWQLLLLAATVFPLLWLMNRRVSWLVKREVFTFQRDFEGFARGVQFALRQMDLTRLRAYDAQEKERQQERIDDLRASGHRMAMSFAVHSQVHRTLAGLSWILILIVGGAAVAGGSMSLGSFLTFNVAAGMLKGHIDSLLGEVPALIAGNESLVTLRALLDEGEPEPYDGTSPVAFDGSVELRDVHFAYDRPVLRGVSLTLAPGERVAIVGANGAGKSTILNIILGFARPASGQVSAAGLPYDVIDIRSLRRAIGVVPQHPSLFVGTVRENVTYGLDQPPTEADLGAVARITQADAVLAGMPLGWESQIGDQAAMLSGGEAQRLAIARALLGKPRLLVLDEPTNHLDAGSIGPIMSAIAALPDRPGILLISHDPAVIAFADVVYRLDDGALRREPGPSPRVALRAGGA